jgi:asparagine synthase (glutamine-hydrolysing)
VSYLQQESSLPFDVAVEQLDALLKETVRAQLVADVPVGAQLSGGVDSSVIVALMETIRKEAGEKQSVKTFSVGFDVERCSELKYAKLIADRYKTDHHEIVLTAKDFLDELPLLSWVYDEPMGEAPAVPTYLMCKMAKQKVTVMLCGEGSDEQFGGYRKYPFDQLSRYVDWMPRTLRSAVLRGAGALMPFRLRRVRSILEILALTDRSSRFASWYGALDTATKETLLDPELQESVGDVFLREVFDEVIATCDSRHSMDQFLYCDIHTRLVDTLLLKADRMSMGASIESRVPFLDPKVVSFAAGLPRHYKVKGLRTKILLKKVAERYAPREVIYRRKVGFVMPLTDWYRGPMRGFLESVLLGERSLARGYYKPDALRRIVNDHLDGRVDREQGIWVLLALELWHRLYMDDDGTEEAVGRLKESLGPVFN